jgi:hypothetical protein
VPENLFGETAEHNIPKHSEEARFRSMEYREYNSCLSPRTWQLLLVTRYFHSSENTRSSPNTVTVLRCVRLAF